MVDANQPRQQKKSKPRNSTDVSFFSDAESSEDPGDWTFPHITYIKKLYAEMVDQGFYKPHVELAKPFSKVDLTPNYQAGTGEATINLRLLFRICTRPPTKLDFINALGYMQPLPEWENKPGFKDIPRAWYQMVAEKMAERCKHGYCQSILVPCLGLVQNCYETMPKPDLANP